jgi:hypothetical protein
MLQLMRRSSKARRTAHQLLQQSCKRPSCEVRLVRCVPVSQATRHGKHQRHKATPTLHFAMHLLLHQSAAAVLWVMPACCVLLCCVL